MERATVEFKELAIKERDDQVYEELQANIQAVEKVPQEKCTLLECKARARRSSTNRPVMPLSPSRPRQKCNSRGLSWKHRQKKQKRRKKADPLAGKHCVRKALSLPRIRKTVTVVVTESIVTSTNSNTVADEPVAPRHAPSRQASPPSVQRGVKHTYQ